MGGQRGGQMIFSSPETSSQVRVDVWDAPENLDWVDWANLDPARFALSLPPESIVPNATVMGQPAFFYFQPSAGGGAGDMATLIFQDGNQVFSLQYHSGMIPAYKAEMAVFQEMIQTFSRASRVATMPTIPGGWENGSSLLVWQEGMAPLRYGEWESQEIEGVVETIDPGVITVTADDGQSYRVGSSGAYFDGTSIDMGLLDSDRFITEGERVFMLARPLLSGNMRAHYMAVNDNGQWLPYAYQAFFDLAQEPIPTSLLAVYPSDQLLPVWLRGEPAQVLPYLVMADGQPATVEDEGVLSILAYGWLTDLSTPKLTVENLFVLSQPCQKTVIAEICYPWQPVYPPPAPTVITTTVAAVMPESGVIILAQPAQGFVTVSVAPDSQMLSADAQPINWTEIRVGDRITAVGVGGTQGNFVAQEVRVK